MMSVIGVATWVYVIGGIVGLIALPIAWLIIYHNVYVRKMNRHPLHWWRTRRGRGKGVAELARRLDMDEGELRRLVPSYRAASIPKKRGGTRRLHVPDKQTKAVQRRVLRRVLARLRPHDAAKGFVAGRSIVDNALPHAAQAVVVKMDVKDFFDSTKAERVDAYLRRVGWNAEAAKLLTELTTHEGGLPQGAPTSPALSNLVNRALDARITRRVVRFHGMYTRYADDITISFPGDYPRRVRGVIQYVKRICRAHGYEIHVRGKLRVLRRHQRQSVTGLIVNDGVGIGRERRRWLRAVRHRMANGGGATLSESQLAGWEAFESMVRKQAGEG